MSINNLLLEKEELINKLRRIEENCEGISNENTAKKIRNLNVEKLATITKKRSMTMELSSIDKKLKDIDEEIGKLSGTGEAKIIECIKKQRWYFFRNKPSVILDKNTAILWPNLEVFNYIDSTKEIANKLIKNIELDGFNDWIFPKEEYATMLVDDRSFPFCKDKEYHKILGYASIYIWNSSHTSMWLDIDYKKLISNKGCFVPMCKQLSTQKYIDNINNSRVYTEEERCRFTLNLFLENNLIPIFDDKEVTDIFNNIYVVKPQLHKRLNELEIQINEMQENVLLSATFDYNTLLTKYDISAIDTSIIKYYVGIQSWIDELMDKMKYYEGVKNEVVRECNVIGLALSKKYEDSPNLTEEENKLLKERQHYFKKHFELGIADVNNKLLAIKRQAEAIEDKIEEINNGDSAIKELAILENEPRASFTFIVENTANIIKNALKKIEYFERNKEFSRLAVKVWDEWTEDFKVFKTSKREELKNISEDDAIEEEVWQTWYNEWNINRLSIEKQILPLIERGLKGEKNDEIKYSLFLDLLEKYKQTVDKFYLEERKAIYQKFAFQIGGDLQEKFEAESELFKISSDFQRTMQNIIFSIDKVEDRLFLIEWVNNLTDLQVDEVLCFIKDKELSKISNEILLEFAELKRKNYDIFISDAKAYSEELSRRDKEYNSLIFKMRKDLMKK